MSQIRQITEIGILTAMITILGAIKIPNLVPGIEFQLSALLLGLKSISSVVVYPVLLGWHWEHKIF